MTLTKITPGLLALVVSSSALAQSAATFSLEQAMDAAETHSFPSRIVKLSESSETLRRDQAKAGQLPKLTVDGQQIWLDKGTNKLLGKTLPNGQYFPDQVSTAGIAITQPVTGAFVASEKYDLEQKLVDATHQDVLASQLDARTRGAEAYIRLLKAKKLMSVALTSRRVIDAQHGDATKQKNQGRLADLDIRRIDLAAAEADLAIIDAKTQVKLAMVQLEEVTGVLVKEDQPLTDIKAAPVAKAMTGDFKQRAEFQSASIRSDAAEKAKSISRFDYYPGVNVFARYDRDFYAKAIPGPMPFNKSEIQDRFSYGVTMNWTIWDWNLRRSHSRELTEEAQKATVSAEAIASQIRLEQSQVVEELQRSQNAVSVAEQAEKLAGQVYDAINNKFRNGLSTTYDLLTAERDRSRAQANFAVASYDLALVQIKWKRAAGQRP